MNSNPPYSPGGPRPMRKGITLSARELVSESFLTGASLPLLFKAAVEGLSLPQWAAANIGTIKDRLAKVGALLFRDFRAPAIPEFEEFLTIVAGDLLDYSYRSTPR